MLKPAFAQQTGSRDRPQTGFTFLGMMSRNGKSDPERQVVPAEDPLVARLKVKLAIVEVELGNLKVFVQAMEERRLANRIRKFFRKIFDVRPLA